MFTKTKIALAAAVLAATSTVTFAQFDPNLANRYPSYADPIVGSARVPHGAFRSAPVELNSGRNSAVIDRQSDGYIGRQDPFEIDRRDRASSHYAGGA
jgi:hypothetical protein